jgi:hypothetical protein
MPVALTVRASVTLGRDSYFIPGRYAERVAFCARPFRPGMCVDRLA